MRRHVAALLVALTLASPGVVSAQESPCGSACPHTLQVEFAYGGNIYTGESELLGMDATWVTFGYIAYAIDGSLIYGTYDLSAAAILAGEVTGWYTATNITYTYEEGGGEWVDDPSDTPKGGTDLPGGPYYYGSLDGSLRTNSRRVLLLVPAMEAA
jgi:hypothetical protein